jgi:glutaminyl-peptide cyclotransferase
VLVLLASSCSDKPQFDGLRAYNDLVKQCDFGPRVPNSMAHEKAGQFLFEALNNTTELIRRQRFTYHDSSTGEDLELTNIIASYNPSSARRILLCAHWDSRPRSDEDPDTALADLPILGANDGASGAAVLLELGRLFKKNPPPIGVDIVLFDGEDYGLSGEEKGWFLGSTYFARHLLGYRPRLAILIDMIGDKNLRIYREAISQRYSAEINDYIWEIASEVGSAAFVDSVKHVVSDDHVPLLSSGIKAIDIIDFDYPSWHTQEDTPDKCSAQSLAEVGKVLVAAIYNKRIAKF